MSNYVGKFCKKWLLVDGSNALKILLIVLNIVSTLFVHSYEFIILFEQLPF